MSVTIDIPKDLQDAYRGFAKEQNTTEQELMQKALIAYLEDLEDLSVALEWMAKSPEEKRKEREQGIPAQELYKELGLR